MLARYLMSSCVCVSQAVTVPKQLNAGSRKHCHTMAHGLYFTGTKDLCEISMGSPHRGCQTVGWVQTGDF